jgi:hypothetical protein
MWLGVWRLTTVWSKGTQTRIGIRNYNQNSLLIGSIAY